MKRRSYLILAGLLGFAPVAARANDFYNLAPCRVLDTRGGSGFPTNTPMIIQVSGLCGVPEDASAVAVNATVLPRDGISVDMGLFPGDLTATPPLSNVVSTGQRPVVSSVAVIGLSEDGSGRLAGYASSASSGVTDLVLDVTGYFMTDPMPSTWPGPGDDEPGDADNLLSEIYVDSLGEPPPDQDAPSAVIGQGGAGSHYFMSAGGQPVPLVGVSADNACHFLKTGVGQCNYGNYQKVINDTVSAGLNVIRLWVNVGGYPMKPPARKGDPLTCQVDPAFDPNDQPFAYSATNPQSDGLGRWKLDVRNADYFARLKAVVQYAVDRGMYVEVTLFSPGTGNLQLSPWSASHASLNNGQQLPGFSNTRNFMNIASSEYLAMKPYVFNVIRWTVDELSSFPTVYYEVANEPEAIGVDNPGRCPGWGGNGTTTPSTVAAWQNEIAAELKSRLDAKGSNQQIAVEASTTLLADLFRSGSLPGGPTGPGPYSSASIINSHYTRLNPAEDIPSSDAGLGAIRLVRRYNNQQRIFGFNETKIVTGGCALASGGKQSVAEGRAEAWEFMVDQGGVYNSFSYGCPIPSCPTSPPLSKNNYCETRRQMGILRSFLSLVNIGRNMMTSLSSGPSWINIGSYPEGPYQRGVTYKFWAAAEPTAAASTKRWVLYVHRSKEKGKTFSGYQAATTTPASYRESPSTSPLSVCLGPTARTYTAKWIDPANAVAGGVVQPLQTQTIIWPGATSCTPGGPGSVQLDPSPKYSFDIVLYIS